MVMRNLFTQRSPQRALVQRIGHDCFIGEASTTWSRKTSATDRARFIAGSGRPRVLGPTELSSSNTQGLSLEARPESTEIRKRSDVCPQTEPRPADLMSRRSEAEPR